MAKRPVFPQKLRTRLFTWAEAKQLDVSWNEIQRQLKTGGLERMSRGVYRVPAEDINDEEQFRIATLRLGGDSAVCLLSALAFYGLTDIIPRAVWLLVPVEKHTRFTGVRLFRKREPRFNVGVVREKGYSITSVEQIKRLAAEPKSRLKFSQIRVIVAIERVIARLEAEPRVRALRATLMPLRLTSTRKNRWS